MLKKIFSHTAIYGLSPQIPKIASLFTLPIITKDLTSTDYGVMGVIAAFVGAISVLAQLGLRVVLVNSFYHSPGQFRWAWRQIYGFLIYWNFVYALILSLTLFLIIPTEARDNAWLIIILNVLPLVFFGPTSTLAQTYYQVAQKPAQIGIRSAVFGSITVGLNVLFISGYKMGYMGWFWSSFIVGVLLNLSYWYPLNYKLKISPIFNFKRKYLKRRLKVSLPTVPHYYSGYLLDSSDKMVMEISNVSTGNIGKYNFAYLIGNVVQMLGVASGKAIGPLMNEAYKKGEDLEARNIVFLLQGVFLLGTFTIALWMKEIFTILVNNDELEKLYPLAIIIMMGYNYRPMYMGANNKLFYTENTHILWRVTFTAGILNVLLNLILIPMYGFEIAALTTFFSFMVMGYAGFYLKIFKKINTVKYYPVFWLSITILLTIGGYYAVELPVIYKLILSLLIIVTSFFVMKRLKKLF